MLGLYNTHTNTAGEKVRYRDGICWLRAEFDSYEYKESFAEDEPWKKVTICHSATQQLLGGELEPLNVNVKRLSEKKLTDIRKQIHYVPVAYRPFYFKLAESECSHECSQASDDSQLEETDASPSQHTVLTGSTSDVHTRRGVMSTTAKFKFVKSYYALYCMF